MKAKRYCILVFAAAAAVVCALPAAAQVQPIFEAVELDRETGARAFSKPGPGGKLPPVGNAVDVANASWTNTIGASELTTVRTDPDFDPKQRAFYYARVIEIPTPRWTAYDAKRYGVKMDAEVPMIVQERACASPSGKHLG